MQGGRQLPGDEEAQQPREDVRSGRTREAFQPLPDLGLRFQKVHCASLPQKGSENTPRKLLGPFPGPGGPAAAGRPPRQLMQLSVQLRREN